jgi:predicted nucleic acid-binding protein
MYLLDTNVISEWVKPRPDGRVQTFLSNLTTESIVLPAVAMAEIAYGIERLPISRQRRRLEQWFLSDLVSVHADRVASFDLDCARCWARIVMQSERRGRPMDTMDSLIAATAMARELTLVTRNTRHFDHLRIELLDPWSIDP